MLKRKIIINNIEDYKEKMLSSKKIELEGIIRYNPERKGLKTIQSCCIIELDSGVSDFYRYLINKEYGINLVKPSWGAHISIIQGNDAKNSEKHLSWNKYEGRKIKFTYTPFPRFSGDTDNKYGGDSGWFWFLNIQCDFINELRLELNLGKLRSPHLTVARKC